MRLFRITLIAILLTPLAYLGYVQTRPGAVPGTAPQQKPSPSTPRNPVPLAPVVQPVAVTSTNTAPAQFNDKFDQDIIARAKAAKVSDLQPGMPNQRFGDWIQETFSNKATISWEVNDCGENDGSGHQD